MRALVQKILHQPVNHLRNSVKRGDIDVSASQIREIFGLELDCDNLDGDRADEVSEANGSADDAGPGPRRLLRGGKDDA